MNVEISKEDIEKIVEKHVGEYVKEWFRDNKNKYFIREVIDRCVKAELEDIKYSDIIAEEARKITSKEVVQRVCDRVSSDIAGAYADKYGDY